MRKLVAKITLSTLAALGAVATVAGTASALEPSSDIDQAALIECQAALNAFNEQLESASSDDKLLALLEQASSVEEFAMLMNQSPANAISDINSSCQLPAAP